MTWRSDPHAVEVDREPMYDPTVFVPVKIDYLPDTHDFYVLRAFRELDALTPESDDFQQALVGMRAKEWMGIAASVEAVLREHASATVLASAPDTVQTQAVLDFYYARRPRLECDVVGEEMNDPSFSPVIAPSELDISEWATEPDYPVSDEDVVSGTQAA